MAIAATYKISDLQVTFIMDIIAQFRGYPATMIIDTGGQLSSGSPGL